MLLSVLLQRMSEGADPSLAALLSLVAAEEGLSVARACKRLGLSRSQLQRLLAEAGESSMLGGLGLVRVEADGERQRLWLTDRCKAALAGQA